MGVSAENVLRQGAVAWLKLARTASRIARFEWRTIRRDEFTRRGFTSVAISGDRI